MISRPVGSLAVLGISALAVLSSATTASAHTPTISASCVDDKAVIAVQLVDYNAEKQNKLIVTDNGDELVSLNFASGHRFQRELNGAVSHELVVEVKAWDDPDSIQGWSFKKTMNVPRCVKTTTTVPPVQTTTPAPTTTSSTPTPSSQVVASPSPSEPVAQVVGRETPAEPLAATGASPQWLLAGGVALLGVGGAALLVARRRQGLNVA